MYIMYLTLRFIQLQLLRNNFFYAKVEVSPLYVFLITRNAMIKKSKKKTTKIL